MYGILFALLCVSYTRTYTQTHNVPFSKDDDWQEQQVHQNVIKTFSLLVSVYHPLLYQVPIQLISSSISGWIWITSVPYLIGFWSQKYLRTKRTKLAPFSIYMFVTYQNGIKSVFYSSCLSSSSFWLWTVFDWFYEEIRGLNLDKYCRATFTKEDFLTFVLGSCLTCSLDLWVWMR